MMFGQAISITKGGYRVTRRHWKNALWISHTPGKILNLAVNDIWTSPIKQVAEENGGMVELLGYFNMCTTDNKIQIGWSPSVEDVLATDWELVL